MSTPRCTHSFVVGVLLGLLAGITMGGTVMIGSILALLVAGLFGYGLGRFFRDMELQSLRDQIHAAESRRQELASKYLTLKRQQEDQR